MTKAAWKITPDNFFNSMPEEDFREFERIFERFDQARQLWLSLVGRDWHVGADGPRWPSGRPPGPGWPS
jgi:hypothetical protein